MRGRAGRSPPSRMLACASAVYVRFLPVIGSEIDVFAANKGGDPLCPQLHFRNIDAIS